MAEQLDMGRLSLNDSQHAPSNNFTERSAYIPPHLRGRAQPPPQQAAPPMDGPPMMNGNMNGMNGGGAWGGPG